MGLIAKVLEFSGGVARLFGKASEVTGDGGAGANVTADSFAPPGVDAQPLRGDYALFTRLRAAGRMAAAGFADPLLSPKAAGGEIRLYARNAAGVEVGEIWLKGDGSIVLTSGIGASLEMDPLGTIKLANAIGSMVLNIDGSFEHWTGAKISALGDFVLPTGVSFMTHVHNVTATGAPSGPAISPPAP